MPIYRCTRPDLYGPDTPGYKDRTARQGHYIKADNPTEAKQIMHDRFPGEKIDVQFWSDNEY